MSGQRIDFFISHAGRDTAWAEWLAWQLQESGYRVELDVWDWAPGEDFVARMQTALESADRLLAVCSQTYFTSVFGGAELRRRLRADEPTLVVQALYGLGGVGKTSAESRTRSRVSSPPHPRLALGLLAQCASRSEERGVARCLARYPEA